MEHSPTDDDDAFLDGLTSFVDKFVVPLEEEHDALLGDGRQLYDESGAYSKEVLGCLRQVRQAAAGAGYYTMFAPEELGGGGLGSVLLFRAWEALNHRYGPRRLLPYEAIAHWSSGPSFICGLFGSELRASLGDELLSGAETMCFAMSEPDAGSDAWAMATRAVGDGDGWVINGTKQWITNGPHAKYALVFAVTDDELRRSRRGGITCFLVPTATPGFRVDSVIRLFGQIGGNEAILSLTEVRVPDSHVVGELHRGFAVALGGVSLGRLYNAGRCVGMARWALEQATAYALERQAFGRPIADYQGISFPLADSAMDIYAARTMALDCAARLDRGEPAVRELCMVKAFTTEACSRVYDRCMQVLGGMGITNETRMFDGWQTARLLRIADGSAEIMRRNVARALFHGDTGF